MMAGSMMAGTALHICSFLLALFDDVFSWVLWLLGKIVPTAQLMHEGVGCERSFEACRSLALSSCDTEHQQIHVQYSRIHPVDATLFSLGSPHPIRVHEGTFISPGAAFLPRESQSCVFQFVHFGDDDEGMAPPLSAAALPITQADRELLKGVVVLLPGTGECIFPPQRIAVAHQLLRRHHIASVIVMPAFYERRKPAGQWGPFISTVAGWKLQLLSSTMELISLHDHLSRQLARHPTAHTVPIGLGGFSAGGSLAMWAASMIDGNIAVIPMAAPHTMMQAMDGGSVLRRVVPLQLIMRHAWARHGPLLTDYFLQKETELFSVTSFHKMRRRREDVGGGRGHHQHRVVVCVEAMHDRMIPACKARLPLDRRAILGESDVWIDHTIPGGHLTAALTRTFSFVPAISRAFAQLRERLDNDHRLPRPHPPHPHPLPLTHQPIVTDLSWGLPEAAKDDLRRVSSDVTTDEGSVASGGSCGGDDIDWSSVHESSEGDITVGTRMRQIHRACSLPSFAGVLEAPTMRHCQQAESDVSSPLGSASVVSRCDGDDAIGGWVLVDREREREGERQRKRRRGRFDMSAAVAHDVRVHAMLFPF
mmetsp:Transcript_4965/g.13498  ORF Transcript_4965/g.13498 Transcript_4965/m.13498 type:complete len:593 (-) Transcript_4965:1150-2928(-)